MAQLVGNLQHLVLFAAKPVRVECNEAVAVVIHKR